ncbi:MAG: MCP four helix bundle domain-containing protein, partial [Pseudomonadota bacterium]|nr:MCP four helix bundle domain-containing protein [Pseudomonadota bacterium]
MTIKNKLIVGFSIILLIMAYVGWNGLMSLGRLNERLNEVVDVTSEKVKLGARINRNIVAINRAEKDMILANNVEKINFFTDIIENLKMEIRDALGKLDKLADEQGQQDLAKFRNVFEDYLALVEEVRQLTLTDISTHSQRLSQRDAEVILNEIMSIINKLIASNQTLPEAPNQAEKLNLVIQLATHMLNIQYQEKNMMLAKTVENKNNAIEQVEQLTKQVTAELKQLHTLANAKEQELITALRTHYKNYIDLYQKIIELDYNEGNEQATVLSTGKSFELINQAEAVMKDIVDKNDNEMVNVRIATDKNYATSRL